MSATKSEKRIEKWDPERLGDEASLKDEDEIRRQILRGDESVGNPDGRDASGAPDLKDTPHGREELKTIEKERGNGNG